MFSLVVCRGAGGDTEAFEEQLAPLVGGAGLRQLSMCNLGARRFANPVDALALAFVRGGVVSVPPKRKTVSSKLTGTSATFEQTA